MTTVNVVFTAPKKFCSFCGKEMIAILRYAEENMQYYGDQETLPLASRFDKDNGKENFCWKYVCPNFVKNTWLTYDPHDNYFLNKVIQKP